MSVLAGVFNRDGAPVAAGLAKSLLDALSAKPADGDGVWTGAGAGLACRNLWCAPEDRGELQPAAWEGRGALIFDGRLDNREELIARLGLGPAGRELSDAQLIAAGYRAWRERLWGRLAGDFALALFDAAERRLWLVRDPMGLRPLYYAEAGRSLVFSSEAKAVLAHPGLVCRPDDAQLAAFLIRREADPARSFFAGVRSLPPAHCLEAGPGGFVLRRYWDFDYSRRLDLPRFEDYAEAYAEAFKTALRRRLRTFGPAAVSVSGGLDSSAVLYQARALGGAADVFGLTYGFAAGGPADERAFLREVEKAAGAPIASVALPERSLCDLAQEQVEAAELPLADPLGGARRSLQQAAVERGARLVLSGHWADQLLFQPAYLLEWGRRLRWRRLLRELEESQRWFADTAPGSLRRLLWRSLLWRLVPRAAEDGLRRLRSSAQASPFTPSFRSLAWRFQPAADHAGASAYQKSLIAGIASNSTLLLLESARKTASLDGVEAAFPFLDRDLAAFMLAVPGEMHARGGVPKSFLREASRGLLPEAVRLRRDKGDATSAVNQTARRSLAAARERLGPRCLAVRRGYLSAGGLRAALGSIERRLDDDLSAAAAWELADLVALESWLNRFFPENGRVRRAAFAGQTVSGGA